MVMGRTRKAKNVDIGKALSKKSHTGDAKIDRHKNVEQLLAEPVPNLQSVTEESSYDEFIATASLANKEFTAEKLNVKFVSLTTKGIDDNEENQMSEIEKNMIVVPRRPQWVPGMTPEELDELEREAFLEWRRSMAKIQEKEGITPFERNIEVWRQLWRVIERSNIMVQIVDARHPLLYRCEDLELYIKEKGKINVLLINKADFLLEEQRKIWSNYFKSINLPHAFYSAKEFTINATSETIPEEDNEKLADESDSGSSEDENEEMKASDNQKETTSTTTSVIDSKEDYRILNRSELIEYLKSFRDSNTEESSSTYTVGFVGYPNVGKSSTLNSLLSIKQTSVSSTPGKTKHFQTHNLEEDLVLCDCPGLVMPAFSGSKGEMVLGGILPIDQLTNYAPPMEILVKRISQQVLEYKYGVSLEDNYTFEDFLNSYASIRGFMTARGLPDCSRASRFVLKDYVNGKIEYNHPPPNISYDEFKKSDMIEIKTEKGQQMRLDRKPVNNEERFTPTENKKEKMLDTQFFKPTSSTAHIKGRQMIPSGLNESSDKSSEVGEKPWRNKSKIKKEKLRRVYRHLDV